MRVIYYQFKHQTCLKPFTANNYKEIHPPLKSHFYNYKIKNNCNQKINNMTVL
jgi:hypothetical protein